MELIERTIYLERLRNLRGTPDIKIITGVRRAGKSKILEALRDEMVAENSCNVIYLDLSILRNEPLCEYHALNDYVEAHAIAGVANVLMIDEVQECKGFERTINSLNSSGLYDMYLTGSNAFLLSSDLATLFTGRQIEIPVYPFSFAEYCQYYGSAQDAEAMFDRYLTVGGLAGSYVYRTEQDRLAYLREVFETILTRDLVQKFRLTEPKVLRCLAEYLMDNISNQMSANKASTQLVQNKIATNHVTAANYIEYLQRAFLFYPVKRYDIKGRRYLSTNEKYYLSDLGFRYAILGRRNMDWGRAIENVVLVELLRRGYEVSIGKVNNLEVDFIATRGGEKVYIQVSDNISDADTLHRELRPFMGIRDAYAKWLIARTRHEEYDHNGIRIMNVADWLLAGGSQRAAE